MFKYIWLIMLLIGDITWLVAGIIEFVLRYRNIREDYPHRFENAFDNSGYLVSWVIIHLFVVFCWSLLDFIVEVLK